MQSASSRNYASPGSPGLPPNRPERTAKRQASSHPYPSETSPAPKVSALNIKLIQREFDQRQVARERRTPEKREEKGLPQIARMSGKVLTLAVKDIRNGMSEQDLEATDRIILGASMIIEGSDIGHSDPEIEDGSADSEEADSPEILADIEHVLECMKAAAAEHPGEGPEAQQQRRCAVLDVLGAVFRNEFKNDAGRWAANLTNVTLRTGLVVTLCTFMRDAISFEVSKASKLGASSLNVAALLAVIIAPAFNLLGGVLSGYLGTANRTSIISRLGLGLASLGVIAASYYLMGSLVPLGEIFSAFACYSAARDLCNFFFPLKDNLTSLPMRSVLGSGAIYALFQGLGGMVMGVVAPQSGANGLPHAVGNATVLLEQIANTQFNAVDSIIHSVFNSILEIGDDLILPLLVRNAEIKAYRLKEERHIQDEAVHRKYVDELSQFATALLAAPADQRQQMIDEKNVQLYTEELERMKQLDRDGLDDAHKQYLEHLELASRYLALSEAPDSANIEELRKVEIELGIYKKTQELARMGSMAQLDDAQGQYLSNLRRDVEICRDRLDELTDDLWKLNQEERQQLKMLQYEFADTPARLPPMSMLGVHGQTPLDFTDFDKKIDRACRRRDPKMTKNDRMKIVRELFEYQFLRTYLPLPLTPLEQRELKNMLRKNPEILPSALPATLAQQAATNRHNATAGLSIQLDFFPSSATPAFEAVRRVGRQVFITDAARQSLFLFAVGSVVLALEFLSENSDDATQIVLGNVIVALATLVAYPALYLMHMEGASRERPIERPGAWSRMPPLREEEPESEEVITPRNHQESGDDDRNLSRADREPSRAAGSEVKHDDESVAGSDENLGSHENIESDEDESDDYIQSDESESDENVKLDLSSPRLSPSPRRTQVQWME